MKLEVIQSYFKNKNANRIELTGVCHDCKKNVIVCFAPDDSDEITITGAAVYQPQKEGELFYKCNVCYIKNKSL
jgi:hypothetical protein